jgi:hypothetical protein
VINPGSRPVDNATEEAAEQNLQAFIDAATERGLVLTDEPERRPDLDTDGRYGWALPRAGGAVEILMPGAPLEQLHGPTTDAYCIRVGRDFWWWNDAIGQATP